MIFYAHTVYRHEAVLAFTLFSSSSFCLGGGWGEGGGEGGVRLFVTFTKQVEQKMCIVLCQAIQNVTF